MEFELTGYGTFPVWVLPIEPDHGTKSDISCIDHWNIHLGIRSSEQLGTDFADRQNVAFFGVFSWMLVTSLAGLFF